MLPHWVRHLLDPLSSLCDDWCLHFWEVVGVWVTGFATFAAVIVSLLLARREQIQLKVSAGVYLVVGPGSVPNTFPEVLSIKISNIGGREATIENIAWRRRPWGHLYALQTFDPAHGYPGPPAKIDAGSSRNFTLPLSNTEMKWGEWFLKDFVGRRPRIGVHLIRVIAYTPAGVQCSASLDKSLKRWLIEKSEQMSAGSPTPS